MSSPTHVDEILALGRDALAACLSSQFKWSNAKRALIWKQASLTQQVGVQVYTNANLLSGIGISAGIRFDSVKAIYDACFPWSRMLSARELQAAKRDSFSDYAASVSPDSAQRWISLPQESSWLHRELERHAEFARAWLLRRSTIEDLWGIVKNDLSETSVCVSIALGNIEAAKAKCREIQEDAQYGAERRQFAANAERWLEVKTHDP